jgi:hypothetical protein
MRDWRQKLNDSNRNYISNEHFNNDPLYSKCNQNTCSKSLLSATKGRKKDKGKENDGKEWSSLVQEIELRSC